MIKNEAGLKVSLQLPIVTSAFFFADIVKKAIHFLYLLLPAVEFIFANWRNQIQQLVKMNLPAGIRSFYTL